MEHTFTLLLVLAAGILQGSFVLPMTLAKGWKWEHIWFTFSALGMVGLNLLLAFLFVNNLQQVYSQASPGEVLLLGLFGLGWGAGAVLFGIGMEKLGMSLGYPVIMGLTAGMGGLLPMFILHPADSLQPSGLLMLAGTALVIGGIVVCSRAAATRAGSSATTTQQGSLKSGIIIAVLAGILSSLPNIGFTLGSAIIQKAIDLGTTPSMAGNAVWAIFFTAGFVPNLLYTVYLIRKNHNAASFITQYPARNFGFGLLMALLWIGSFYLYGFSSYQLGQWGNIIGWPVFISLSIIVGNLWGIWKGEWKTAGPAAKRQLNLGLLIQVLAMAVIGLSNAV
jgi:L-rhamnose-H+ transport protein